MVAVLTDIHHGAVGLFFILIKKFTAWTQPKKLGLVSFLFALVLLRINT